MASTNKTRIPEGPVFDENGFYVPNSVFLALSVFFVALRLWSRRIQRLTLDASDYCVTIALVFSILVAVAAYIGVANGAGEHVAYLIYLDPSGGKVELLLKALMLATIPYLMSLAFSRISILLIYRHLFPTRFMRISTVVLGIVVSMITISGILATVFSCRPVEGFWLVHTMQPPPQCVNTNTLYVSVGLLTIVSDAACLVLPIWDILKLKLSRRDKITILAMFFMGGLTIVVSVPRVAVIAQGDGDDITFWIASVALWSTIETAVAIICVCLPVLRPVVRRVRGWLGVEQVSEITRSDPVVSSGQSKIAGKEVGGAVVKSHGQKKSVSFVEMKPIETATSLEAEKEKKKKTSSTVEVRAIDENERYRGDVRPGNSVRVQRYVVRGEFFSDRLRLKDSSEQTPSRQTRGLRTSRSSSAGYYELPPLDDNRAGESTRAFVPYNERREARFTGGGGFNIYPNGPQTFF